MDSRHSSPLMSRASAVGPAMPELFTSTSTRP